MLSPAPTHPVVLALLAMKAAEGIDGSGIPAGYSKGFVRVAPDGSNRGSFVAGVDSEEKTLALLGELDWQLVDRAELPPGAAHSDERVTYYRAKVPEQMQAFTGVLPLRQLLAMSSVEVIAGSHGPEMVAAYKQKLVATTEVWAILGPIDDREDLGLWSWYPGAISLFASPAHKALLTRWMDQGFASLKVDELLTLLDLPVKLRAQS